MNKFDVAIIGAGASGLAAAIGVKRTHKDYSVVLFDRMPKVGKKILATGNGRCNITNLNAVSKDYNNPSFVSFAMNKYKPAKVIEFFNSLGLYTYSDSEGRAYPRSNNASSVLDALRFETQKCGVTAVTDCQIDSVIRKNGKFIINNAYACDKLILACGGKASPSQGSNGSGYELAKSLGHGITPLTPSLVPLITEKNGIKSLKGIRASSVSLTAVSGSEKETAKGEILFTDSGVSGIAAMELAAFCERNKANLHIDFLPEYNREELKGVINSVLNIRFGQPSENLLSGLLPKALGVEILKKSMLFEKYQNISAMSGKELDFLISQIKDFTLDVKGSRGFNDAQVTSGGVKCNEIYSDSLMSKKCDNLYFCGEIIDVDGPCGGYNLQWAFASGLLAGELK